MFNKLLERQIRKIFGNLNSIPEGMESLLRAISDAYDSFDTDRKLIEHSFDVSSEEFISTNKKLSLEIAERVKMEKELQESEAKLKIIFNNSGGAIFIAELSTGKIIDCNIYAEKIIGCSKEEIIGMHQTDLYPSHEKKKSIGKFNQIIQQGCVAGYEGILQYKDGGLVPVLINTVVVKDIVVSLFLNISQQKEIERELKEKLKDSERFKEITIGREIKMIELKKEINSLSRELGRDEPYDVQFAE